MDLQERKEKLEQELNDTNRMILEAKTGFKEGELVQDAIGRKGILAFDLKFPNT